MSIFTIKHTPSPNHASREGQQVDMLIMHYTDMESAGAALAKLCDPAPGGRVSAHYLVDEDGTVFALVDESETAWHAGLSSWRGNTNINQRSIGIEIANPGHRLGYRPFPEAQMQSVITLSKGILSRHAIPARNVVAHSDIAPERKRDPGELFDWAWLSREGVGLWPLAGNRGQWTGDSRDALSTVHRLLSTYGYDISNIEAAITAFQRHFRPKNLSGKWDEECGMLLAALLSMV